MSQQLDQGEFTEREMQQSSKSRTRDSKNDLKIMLNRDRSEETNQNTLTNNSHAVLPITR